MRSSPSCAPRRRRARCSSPAAERLAARLAAIEVKKPAVPVIHNRSVEAYDDPDRIRRALVEQLDHPVRWIEIVQFLASHAVDRIVECGPGKVLTGLNKRIAPAVAGVALQDTAALEAALA